MTLISKTEQSVGEARATVGVNDDDINAGYNDTAITENKAGGFRSFPTTASMGNTYYYASNNSGNYIITHTNASFGQSTDFLTNDPANANAVHMIGAGTAPFVNGNLVKASGTGGLMVDAGIPATAYQPVTVIVTLNTAAVIAAYATPQLIVAAPSSGFALVPLACQIITVVSTAFTSGGNGQLQWGNTVHAGGVLALDAVTPTAEITAAASQIYTQYGLPTTTVTAIASANGLGLYWTNATQAFATGTGSTVTLAVNYMTVPV